MTRLDRVAGCSFSHTPSAGWHTPSAGRPRFPAGLAMVTSLWLGACAHQAPAAPKPPAPPPVQAAPAAASVPEVSTASAFCSAETHHSSERALGVEGALADLNTAFLRAHANARQQRCSWLEHEGLVLRYADGQLEARLQGHVVMPATSVLPQQYHPIKDVVHSLMLAALIAGNPDPVARQAEVPPALQAIDAVLAELAQPGSTALTLIMPEHVPRQRRILQQARAALLAPDLTAARSALTAARRDLDQDLELVASATIWGLHKAVKAVREKVEYSDSKAWDSVLVVVAVAHQARAQALEVQYFERLLREPAKEGANGERRLVVAENVSTPADQVGLLATHLADGAGGELLFGDPTRLQRDVLSSHDGELDKLLPPPPSEKASKR